MIPLVILFAACTPLETAEGLALGRLRAPVVIPLAKADWPPLCWRAPLLFWERAAC